MRKPQFSWYFDTKWQFFYSFSKKRLEHFSSGCMSSNFKVSEKRMDFEIFADEQTDSGTRAKFKVLTN